MAINTFAALTADGSTAALTLNDQAPGDSDQTNIVATGTWGGGTLVLEGSVSASGTSDFAPINGVSFTANKIINVNLTGLKRVRGTLSGSTNPNLVLSVCGANIATTVANS